MADYPTMKDKLERVLAEGNARVLARATEASEAPGPASNVMPLRAPVEAKVKAAMAAGQKSGQETSKEKSAAAQADIEASGTVAIDQYGAARFLTTQGSRYVPIRLDGQDFRDHCQIRAIESSGKAIGKDAITALVEALRGRAVRDSVRVQVHVRVATEVSPVGERSYFLDLANDAGEMVCVNALGWRVVQNTRVAFAPGRGALPVPKRPKDVTEAYVLLSKFLERRGVPGDLVLIVAVALAEWLRPDTAYPILDILGPAGGGKTSLASALVSLVDPTKSGKLAETRLEVEHLGAAAQTSHVLVIDNTSRLTPEEQNLLCRACYGFESVSRKLYTQTQVERLPIHVPVIVTAISPAITAPDLQDRAVRIQFKPRRKFASQVELAGVLEAEGPQILGALLTLFSAGLGCLDTTQRWPHRLVDFAQLGEGIATALGKGPGHFSDQLTSVARLQARDYAEGDELISRLQRVLDGIAKTATAASGLPPLKVWRGGVCAVRLTDGTHFAGFLPSALLGAINRAGTGGDPLESFGRLPGSARALGGAVTLKIPVLTALGIEAEHRPVGRARISIWVFKWR